MGLAATYPDAATNKTQTDAEAPPGNRSASERVSLGMKAMLTLISSALALAACTPAAHSPTPLPSPSVPSSSPSHSTPIVLPSELPTVAPVSCAYPATSIPDRVMVRDVYNVGSGVTETCVDKIADDVYFEYLPDPCGHGLGVKTSSIAARRAIEVTFDDDPSNAYIETSMYRHTVTVYNSGDAASVYLSSVRAAVRECPTRKLRASTWTYTILSSTATRVELSIRRVNAKAEGVPKEGTFRVSIARVGAKVSVLTDVGWEGLPSYKSAVDALVKAASEQLERWG
jgi:hypothetical protein